MNLPRSLQDLGVDLLLAPVRGWLPLMLPLATLVTAMVILYVFAAHPAGADPMAWPAGGPSIGPSPGPATLAAADGVADTAGSGLLLQALTASGLRELDGLGPLVEAGVWLALPGGPYLARLLDPDMRVLLNLRGNLSSGGPYMLPAQGPQILQQASPAAETLLRRCQPVPAPQVNG